MERGIWSKRIPKERRGRCGRSGISDFFGVARHDVHEHDDADHERGEDDHAADDAKNVDQLPNEAGRDRYGDRDWNAVFDGNGGRDRNSAGDRNAVLTDRADHCLPPRCRG